MAEADGKIVYEVRADYDKLDQDIDHGTKKIEKGTSKWSSILQGAGHSIGHTLVNMAKDAAVAIYEMGTAFEDGLAKVSTLVDTSQVDMAALGDSLLDLSAKYGLEASSLAESTYNAISANNALGKDAEGLMSLLESSAKLAKAGFTDLDTATSATLKTLNAYGLGVEEADRIQKILIQTQNTGITTVGELGSVLSQVTPSAAAVGVSFEEVGAAIATMTAQGIPAAQATTQLNAIFTSFLKPTEKLGMAFNGMGYELLETGIISGGAAEQYKLLCEEVSALITEQSTLNLETKEGKERNEVLKRSIESTKDAMTELSGDVALQVVEAIGLQETLGRLNTRFDGSTAAMASAMGSSEALRGSLALTGKNAETFTSNLKAMSTETDVVGEGFEKVAGTSSEKLNRSMTTLKNTGIKLWQAISPIVTVLLDLANTILGTVVNALSGLIKWISDAASAVGRFFSTLFGGGGGSKKSNSHAVGLDFVPSDGYPAVLHRGEAVLTAAEAKVWREGGNTRAGALSGSSGGAAIDYDRLAAAMSGLTVVMDGQAVGRLVEPTISNVQARKVESLQRSGFNGRV